MGDVHYIVDKLGAEPFNCPLTLLEFRWAPIHAARQPD
jgi:hypothetical protein